MSHPSATGSRESLLSGCRLIVVQDVLQECPYRDGLIARMPLRLPLGSITEHTVDRLLAAGYRRSGDFVYRTECPACQACESTRIDVREFRLSDSLKRVLHRGDRDLVCSWGKPSVDPERVALFNRHRRVRGLERNDREVDADSYRCFLVDSCLPTRELSVTREGRLVAVSVVDVGAKSLSAVYTHFDPDEGRYSLGTYAILKMLQLAADQGFTFVYLGMYVADNRHLNYKSRFTPQERLVGQSWTKFHAGEAR